MSIADEYRELLKNFADGRMTAKEFEVRYLTKFKEEVRELDEQTFEVLDVLFGDVDAFTGDKVLIEENPEFYIDEVHLMQRVLHAISQLK